MVLAASGIGPRRQIRVVGEKFGIMLRDHAAAGAGRHDDIVKRSKASIICMASALVVCAVAGVEGRLAAAGLARHLDRAARILQELGGGEADARPDQIDEAGGEEGDAQRRRVSAGMERVPGERRDAIRLRRQPQAGRACTPCRRDLAVEPVSMLQDQRAPRRSRNG